jgi:hypothetical protein
MNSMASTTCRGVELGATDRRAGDANEVKE